MDTRHPESAAIDATLVNIPQLANLTGLSQHTIRSILLGRRRLRQPNREKLAEAIRQHATRLSTLADQLDSA